MSRGKGMTEIEKETILRLHAEGIQQGEIGRRLGRSQTAIGQVLRKAGIHAPVWQEIAGTSCPRCSVLYPRGASGRRLACRTIACVRAVLAERKIRQENKARGTPESRHRDLLAIVPCRVRMERLRAGLSMLELANKIGLARVTIESVEKGVSLPSLDTLWRIARALGVMIDDLCTEESDA